MLTNLILKAKAHCRMASFQLSILLLAASCRLTPLHAAELIPLQAGPVTAVFDANNVFLRYIRVGGHEVLRGINAPFRRSLFINHELSTTITM